MKELHCSPNTVRKIIRQGMTPLYHGKVQRFKAKTAWQVHKENRSRCCRTYKAAEKRAFLSYVESHFCGDDKWSLDACVGYALAHNLFDRSEMLCTKTLYNYVELGLLGIKNIDLPQKLLGLTLFRERSWGYRTPDEAFEAEMDRIFAV